MSDLSTENVNRIASIIMTEILDDIQNGTVPTTVASFSELHDYVDANMYADDELPLPADGDDIEDDFDAMDDRIDLINLVQNEVDRRLRERITTRNRRWYENVRADARRRACGRRRTR